jgi:hypothetical protein
MAESWYGIDNPRYLETGGLEGSFIDLPASFIYMSNSREEEWRTVPDLSHPHSFNLPLLPLPYRSILG